MALFELSPRPTTFNFDHGMQEPTTPTFSIASAQPLPGRNIDITKLRLLLLNKFGHGSYNILVSLKSTIFKGLRANHRSGHARQSQCCRSTATLAGRNRQMSTWVIKHTSPTKFMAGSPPESPLALVSSAFPL